VTLRGEDIVEGDEALDGSCRFEALHLPFPSPQKLVRIFGSVVGVQALVVATAKADLAERGTVGAQLVGHDNARQKPYRFNSFRNSLKAAELFRRF
jgi:hypothetical protein